MTNKWQNYADKIITKYDVNYIQINYFNWYLTPCY